MKFVFLHLKLNLLPSVEVHDILSTLCIALPLKGEFYYCIFCISKALSYVLVVSMDK